ncbi:MAG: response regulator transcription factor [Clostridium sp.]|uniref:response regulator transcription factor n=1 Tax=Clostridium sp. TaxID=1506 RepID=UPI002909CB61|nr:response regulator transcription factor [Clostridium sp.]MDU4937639.1 response regulator transcription factor [Clostridium sp.]
MCIKVAIVDDDELIRESLKIIVGSNEDIDVKGTFKNGQELLKYLEGNYLDVVLMDIRMPILNGVETLAEMRRRDLKTKVIVLTTFDEDEYIEKSLNQGAIGYLLKNTTPDKIIDTIKMVYNGISVIQEDILKRYKEIGQNTPKGKIDKSLFTDREYEVIVGISQGLSNKEISKKLFISEGTVKNYITSILNKTGLKHRTQIAVYYYTGERI